MSAYLDTHVAVRLANADLAAISPNALDEIAKTDLLVSPMVLLELEYLFELKKETRISADDLRRKLEYELGVKVCRLNFQEITAIAAGEKWTRDPFDRIIVAHAKSKWPVAVDLGRQAHHAKLPQVHLVERLKQ